MARKSLAKPKRANWKGRAIAAEYARITLGERVTQLEFDSVKDKDAIRTANQNYMNAQRNLMRAITTIESAVEIFTAMKQHASAASFRMIANDLALRCTCEQAIAPKDERH